MVEIGFGAFLEKIEEHFGKGVLKMLLMLCKKPEMRQLMKQPIDK